MEKFLVLLFLIKLAFVYTVNAQLVDCLESDQEALLDFKNGLFDPENHLSSWTGSDCCQWPGIGCENSTGAVITIDLCNPHPSNFYSSARYGFWNLSGEIRPSLAKLKSLRHLDLSSNSFKSIPIPQFLGSMENLQYLNLSNSGFSGAVPPNLGNLSSLQYLDVSLQFLTVHNIEWVTGLISLKHLAMDEVDLSKVEPDWIGALNKLPFLTELHLSSCSLSGPISSLTFVNFTSLAVIDLSYNNFNSKIPDWLVNTSSLISVAISFSRLHGRIPLGFSELPNLQFLNLAENFDLKASCSQLLQGSWRKIVFLDLSANKISGKISASIGNMTSLTYFSLSWNNVKGGIPGSIGKLCKLKYFDLLGNNLRGSLPEVLEGTDQNCHSKSPLPSLQNLVLRFNQMVGNFPEWLGQLESLVQLSMGHNLLQGPIPASLGSLQSLSTLRLEDNKLNGTLPDSLGQLSKLASFDVSSNDLTGIISEGHFTMLSKLKFLYLSSNSLILNVSANWVPPFQVDFLGMGSCHLGPSFPAWLKSQKEVKFLDFSNASISGSVPNWFWKLSSSVFLLNMSFNQLEGQLPNPLNVAAFAVVDFSSNLFKGPIPLPVIDFMLLDLSNNQFSGHIPKMIGSSMRNLVFLSLSGNQLMGEIPASVGDMFSLKVIDLSGNNLTGAIPSNLGNISTLEALDLKCNNLLGEIPDSLGKLRLLQTLHLSDNKLSGEIPSSFHNLFSLETLDLGNNRLTGGIPPWIGAGFTNLRILSLRSNAFSGELPPALSNLSSLQVLDLAENELTGFIPASFGDLKAMAQGQNLSHLFYGQFLGRYYEENFIVNAKGQSLTYTTILSLMVCIDLSGNNLNGNLPEEISKLLGLVFLNLSRNQISGQIPDSISSLHQLSSLDLSSNSLSGPIPPSMSSLASLGYLNLSNNNFSGTIPYTDHMMTFEESSFAGNPGLCGAPLNVECQGDDPDKGWTIEEDTGNDFIDEWFYSSIGLGFAAGIVVPYLILAVKSSWRDAYFRFVDKILENLSLLGYRIALHYRMQHCH